MIHCYHLKLVAQKAFGLCAIRKYKMKNQGREKEIQLAYIMLYNSLYKSTTNQYTSLLYSYLANEIILKHNRKKG